MTAFLTRWCRLAAALLVACGSIGASATPASTRIVAVGDLHGDFAAWRAIAVGAGLIDAGGHWAGGRTILVQTGDVTDRGSGTRDIIADLMRLQREARKAGGQVVALVGNHEAMNLTDDLRYVTPAEFVAFATPGSAVTRDKVFTANATKIAASYRATKPGMSEDAVRQAWYAATPLGLIEHQAAWHPGGLIGNWIVGNPAVALIDGTLFVHGGISAAYAQMSIAEINRRVAMALKGRDAAPAAIINDPAGPLWYRGLALREPGASGPTIEQELTQVLAAYHAQRIVIGHTPILSGIAIGQEGRLIRIDTGISAYYGGALSYLEIIDGKAVAHVVPRPATSKGAGS